MFARFMAGRGFKNYSLQKCQDICPKNICWRKYFLFKIVQNILKIGSFSNCCIYVPNKGKNGIGLSLEITEIVFYSYDNISCHPIFFLLTSAYFEE